VKKFYERNHSPLFGAVTVSREQPRAPDKALNTEDVRHVLKALPIQIRTPLLCQWQSGCEINRILSEVERNRRGAGEGDAPAQAAVLRSEEAPQGTSHPPWPRPSERLDKLNSFMNAFMLWYDYLRRHQGLGRVSVKVSPS